MDYEYSTFKNYAQLAKDQVGSHQLILAATVFKQIVNINKLYTNICVT